VGLVGGVGAVGGLALPWSPLNLGSALLAWWSADYGLTLSGSAVSAWADRKHGYTLTQSSPAARPIFSATGFGGAACLIHDGIDDCLYNLAATGWFPTGSAGLEMHGVGQQDAPAVSDTALRCFVALGNSSFNTDMRQRRQEVSGVNRYQITLGNGAGGASLRYDAVDFSSRHLSWQRAESGQVLYSIDGNAPASAVNAKSVTAEQFAIGSLPNGSSQYWLGRVRHVILTNLLTTDQAAQLTTYLMQERYL
jgi:hypothetical protein